MKTLEANTNLTTPICLVEGDCTALLHVGKMKDEGIPVYFNTVNFILYTDSEEHAEKARYLLFTRA